MIICFCLVIFALTFYFINTHFDFYAPETTLTAGNWGHFEPKFCYQEKPTQNALDSIDKESPTTCNACHLMCSSHSAWQRCQKCLKTN